MLRKTPLRANPDKIREWQQRSRKPIARGKRVSRRAPKRSLEEASYSVGRSSFLAAHPICPVTGEGTTQIHHSAKREGRWLNIQRYWIAVSGRGHKWIEDNKKDAEGLNLMVRIRDTAAEHIAQLQAQGISISDPLFYQNWDGEVQNLFDIP
jgi:hypothetical protein